MSDSMDLEQVEALLRNMGHVVQRVETMGGALGAAWQGVDLPRGCDLSGLALALKSLQAVGQETASQAKLLYDTVTEATKADKSWGDHVKGWLTPPKTGHHSLDAVFGAPASVAAGATDVGYDLGAGVVGLTWDIIDIPGDVNAYRHGDVMPIQKPGLGLINVAANPEDAGKALIGWKYHNDPLRMGTYAVGNLLTMIATGGLGEVAEGTLAARLAKLTAEGSTTSRSLAKAIEDLERRRAELPSSRQRSPGKRKWVRQEKSSIDRDLERLRKHLNEHQEHMTNVRDRYNALANLRNNRWVTGFGDATALYIPTAVQKVVNWISHGHSDAIKEILEKYMELQGYATGGQDYTDSKEARRRLAEFAANHPRS
ncbi:MAG: hypothetical protein QOG34_731 [Frankiaceae bacterium]|jgi:DNA repair exonuclease SbcCD ATPase subunit|nr:hypothetical protein [Frankiaceae bacterium]